MRIYNTATRRKEELTPLEEGHFKIYVCGPTVYDFFHLGNARPFITYDTLRRYLLYLGYNVTYVQNFTDIDDKMIARANLEGITVRELADRMIAEYFRDADALNIMRATIHPRATESIPAIIDLISVLEEKGIAYVGEDGVYFDISKYPDYGKLSHYDLDELEAGAGERVSNLEDKRHALDFALWKFRKEGEPYWDSPWGEGRPGWHIECSAMCRENIGDTVDLHCGGVDLVFPHHENEIAQSEAATGKPFVRFWMHNGFININHIKMSKSKGNFFLVRDLAKLYPYEIIRFFMLQSHYRMPINFTLTDDDDDEPNSMVAAQAGFKRIQTAVHNLDFLAQSAPAQSKDPAVEAELRQAMETYCAEWKDAMDDDLNTADAIAAIFELVRAANTAAATRTLSADALKTVRARIIELCHVLGLEPEKFDEAAIPEDILDMVDRRSQAKKARDFATADALRDAIAERGYKVEDTPEGARVIPLD